MSILALRESYLFFETLIRKNNFIWDECEYGYIKSKDGLCHNCSEIRYSNCDIGHINNIKIIIMKLLV